MQQFINNRYTQMVGLGLGLAVAFYLIIWLVLGLVGMADFPQIMQLGLAVLGSGLIVYKFFAHRIF